FCMSSSPSSITAIAAPAHGCSSASSTTPRTRSGGAGGFDVPCGVWNAGARSASKASGAKGSMRVPPRIVAAVATAGRAESALQRERAFVDAAAFEREHVSELLPELRRHVREDVGHQRLVGGRTVLLGGGDRVIDGLRDALLERCLLAVVPEAAAREVAAEA